MWFAFLLLLLGQQLSHGNSCPGACQCYTNGAVQCQGGIRDVPSPIPVNTNHLYLIRTQITALGEQSFQQLSFLLRLGVSHGPLKTIHPATFDLVPQLLSLKLSSNELSFLPLQVFGNLSGLEQLFLDTNQLVSLQPGLFDALLNLTQLDLSKNLLTHLDRDIFRNLIGLRFLNLAQNFLSQLPGTIFGSLTSLRYLALYSNQLVTFQVGTFSNLTNLLGLDIFKNKIENIPPHLFWSLCNLENLTLSSNALQHIPGESFYYMPKLTKLTFYKNPLTFLPEQLIGHVPRLKQFYLYETELNTVPENLFANMTALESLSLNINRKLEHLPRNIFCCLPNLHRLNLHSNNLQSLHHDIFSALNNLSSLILHSNKLHSLPGDIFHNLPRLADISLHNNNFESLPGNVLSMVSSLRKVTLQNNPWNCTCNILDLAEWMSHRQRLISDYDHVLCQVPSRLLNHTVGSLTSEFLQCGSPSVEGHMVPFFPTDVSRIATSGSLDKHLVTYSSREASTITTDTVSSEKTSSPSLSLKTSYFSTAGAANKIKSIPSTATLVTSPSNTPTFPHTTSEGHTTEGSSYASSGAFYEVVVLEAKNSIVHNNRYKGWVYLWMLPPSGPYSTFLITLHIILVATAMSLLIANAFAQYRLNNCFTLATN